MVQILPRQHLGSSDRRCNRCFPVPEGPLQSSVARLAVAVPTVDLLQRLAAFSCSAVSYGKRLKRFQIDPFSAIDQQCRSQQEKLSQSCVPIDPLLEELEPNLEQGLRVELEEEELNQEELVEEDLEQEAVDPKSGSRPLLPKDRHGKTRL